MSRYQAQEWDERYQSSGHNLANPRAFLVEVLPKLPREGWGLDVAMGEGHNANLLAEHGLQDTQGFESVLPGRTVGSHNLSRVVGKPVADFEQRAADVSVSYPALVSNYRAAQAIAAKNELHQADTEELRQAMIHYRTLFEELLGAETVAEKEKAR